MKIRANMMEKWPAGKAKASRGNQGISREARSGSTILCRFGSRVLTTTLCLALIPVVPLVCGAAEGSADHNASTNLFASFHLPDDLQITDLASNKLQRGTVQFDIDERGRVWLLQKSFTTNENGTRLPGARVSILQASGGDGVAEQEATFYEDASLAGAQAICVLENRVYVSSPPHLFVLTDSRRDGKAAKREILLTGLEVRPDTERTDLCFGPDGKLYFSAAAARSLPGALIKKDCALHGDVPEISATNRIASKFQAFDETTGGPGQRKAVLFRCNADGSELEALAGNFHSASGMAVDSFGNVWKTDRDEAKGSRGGRLLWILEGGNYGSVAESPNAALKEAGGVAFAPAPLAASWHEADPGVVPNVEFFPGASPSHLLAYEAKGLPRRFWNVLIVCDTKQHSVRAYRPSPAGAGYKVTAEDIVTSSDSGFSPVQACAAPDGSLFVLDAADSKEDGQHAAHLYRIGRKGIRPNIPPQDWTSAHGWVGALQSGNRATRSLACARLLTEGAGAERYLLMLSRSLDAPFRARSLQLLARIKGSEDKYVAKCLQETNPIIRLTGLCIARDENRDRVPLIAGLIHDPSPQVRAECAAMLHHCEAPEAPKLWAELAQQYDGEDRWYLEALGIGAAGHWDRYLEAWLELTGSKWNQPQYRDIIWRSRAKKTPALLAELIRDSSVTAPEKRRYFRALEFLSGPEKDAAAASLRSLPLAGEGGER